MPSGRAVGRGKLHLWERLSDPSRLGLVYLVSTKSLQIFPVSGGSEVSAGLAQDGLGHIHCRVEGTQEPTLTPGCSQPVQGHEAMEVSRWLYATGA